MFFEKILSLKSFLVSNIILFCYWYEKKFSLKYFFSLMKCFLGISVITFPLRFFFPSQIIYFLACNKDTILAP